MPNPNIGKTAKGAKEPSLPLVDEGMFEAKASDFFLKEYECLRKEVELLIQESRALERNVIIAVGLTWSWLIAHGLPQNGQDKKLPSLTWFVASLFSILGAIRANGIDKAFGQIGTYLTTIELSFRRKGSPLGWGLAYPRGPSDSRGAFLFWSLLNLSTITVAILHVLNYL